MSSQSPLLPFVRYVRLYTLHQIETPTDLIVRRVRIEMLHYSFGLLADLNPAYPCSVPHINEIYVGDPREGAQMVRERVLPRLNQLLDARDPFAELNLIGDRDALWQRYTAERGLPAQPVAVPGIKLPTARRMLPARSKTSERLAAIQRGLETLHTAAQTANTFLSLWQNWRIGRAQHQLLDTQRDLLQNAIQAQLAGQDQALDRALDQDFVRGYLADHADDPAVDVIFSDDD